MTANARFSLMIHGGAGPFAHVTDAAAAARYIDGARAVVEQGRAMLSAGASALDTVEACAALLEDDPAFNAGRGSVLNELGAIEMDAAIMDGATLAAGAVAGVHNIANPIRLARRVMQDTEHLLLIADGAMRFAEQCGIAQVADDALVTPDAIAEFEAYQRSRGESPRFGTIGAVARDVYGTLAAATSTGGMTGKRVGRVGDSPIVGAGVYADNASCAVSATGHGEDFMRIVMAHTIAAHIEFAGMDAAGATQAGIERLRKRTQGQGGVIVIDHMGRCASAHTTARMVCGWIEHGGKTQIRF